MTTDDPSLLTGAYALDALDAADRETFEQHLADCETCAAEVAGLREAAGRLADDSWSTPPSRLRRQVLERIHGSHRWRRRAARVRPEQARIEAVLTAPDAFVRTAAIVGGGQVTVVASPAKDAAVVVVAGATPPGLDMAYELWTIRGATPRPAGVFAAGQGSATHYVEGISGARVLAVTVESAAGSTTPTLPIVAQLPLSRGRC